MVVEALAELFPQADLFALIARPETMSPRLRLRKITTSFLQKIPMVHRFHRHTLPLQPLALEQFDLSSYDLVISSESGPAKGVITGPDTLHICYCHSPMRYIWDMYPQYVKTMSPFVRAIFALTAHKVRLWDLAASARVDAFICNSSHVAARVRKFYRRESIVIHPPVQVESIQTSETQSEYYLAVGRLVPYKRFDLAVEACTKLGCKLKIIGTGPEMSRLKRMAGPTVEFLGNVTDAEKHAAFASCRALIFPGEEDFGIVPVEAQAHGRPVIALGAGGALETVVGLRENAERRPDMPTGVFFPEESRDSLIEGIHIFEANFDKFVPESIRQNALRFDARVFREHMTEAIQELLEKRK
jgi:glycosyltransferase involved in cell wall biosynthesis